MGPNCFSFHVASNGWHHYGLSMIVTGLCVRPLFMFLTEKFHQLSEVITICSLVLGSTSSVKSIATDSLFCLLFGVIQIFDFIHSSGFF